MRKVIVYKHQYQTIANGIRKQYKVPDYEGTFHGWGVDCDEGESNYGNFTCAIVERQGGEVELVYAGLVKFTEASK